MKHWREVFRVSVTSVLLIVVFMGAYEAIVSRERIGQIEKDMILLKNDLRNCKIDLLESMHSQTRDGDTSCEILAIRNSSKNNDDHPLSVQVEGLDRHDLELYTLYSASVKEFSPVAWTVKVMKGASEVESYQNIEWLLAGKNKQHFKWDQYSRQLEFIGTKYLENGINDYVIALGAWDKRTYMSHEIVVRVSVCNRGVF